MISSNWQINGNLSHLRCAALTLALPLLGTLVAAGFLAGCGRGKGARSAPPSRWARTGPKDPFSILAVMKERPEDRAFRLPSGPKPPRRVTERIPAKFPPPVKPKARSVKKSYGKLKVLRKQPEGKVGVVGHVVVHFNHPMVPLTSLEKLQSIPPPMKVSPRPKGGQFKWLGTSTVMFQTKKRMPFSTLYTVRVPRGTRSALGAKLGEAVKFTFETPRVRLTYMRPTYRSRHVRLNPTLVLFFDQKIRPKQILRHATFSGGGQKVGLRLVSRSDWKNIKRYGYGFKSWDKNQTVVLQPTSKLKKNTSYTLTLKAGLPSAEGPLRTTNPQARSFSTYGPLYVQAVGCSRRYPTCSPGSTPGVYFSNPLNLKDPDRVRRFIRISPRVKKFKTHLSGSYVSMAGKYQPGSKYTVTVKPGLKDIFGQTMRRRYKGSFRVTDVYPALVFPPGPQGVMEARLNRRLTVRSVNVRKSTVTMVKVEPTNLNQALKVLRESYWRYKGNPKAPAIPGKRTTFNTVFNPKKNRVRKTRLKLDRILRGKGGTVFVEIFSKDLIRHGRKYQGYRNYLAQITDVGLTARYDLDRIVVLATGLTSGKPLSGVRVSILRKDNRKVWSGTTDRRGLAVAPGFRKLRPPGPYLVVGRKGKDFAFLRLTGSGQDGGYTSGYWGSMPAEQRLKSYIFAERNPHRPGEKVHLTGMLRIEPTGTRDTLTIPKGGNIRVKYQITDPRRQKAAKGIAKVDSDGMFYVKFKSLKDGRLGSYYFRGTVDGLKEAVPNRHVSHRFKVLAYRPTGHEVTVKIKPGPYFSGDTLPATLSAKYHFGAPMAGAKVRWVLRGTSTTYRPVGQEGYTFGLGWYRSGVKTYRGKGKLDSKGKLVVKKKVTVAGPREGISPPAAYVLEAEVTDENRQAVANRAVVTVHPASMYVGLRLSNYIVKAGHPVKVHAVAANLDGKRIPGRTINVKATTTLYSRKKVKKGDRWVYKWVSKKLTPETCSMQSGAHPRSCELRLTQPGYYTILATSRDPQGRLTGTLTWLSVYGKGFFYRRRDNQSRVELKADKKVYEPGQTAKVLIYSPYQKSVGILAVERKGIVKHRYLNFTGSTHLVTIPINEDQIPNVHVSAGLVRGRIVDKGSPAEMDRGRPRFATGRIKLNISNKRKAITVKVTPAKTKIRPGEKLRITLKATDHTGRPVKARLAVAVADEGVLSLLGFTTPDPLHWFYRHKRPGSALLDLRYKLLKAVLPKMYLRAKYRRRPRMYRRGGRRHSADYAPSAPSVRMGAARKYESAPGRRPAQPTSRKLSFKVRKFFASTAYFNHNITTDRNGSAELTVPMPENLTAFRIMAVAMEPNRSDRFGSGEARVRIGKPLMLRPALPRFANFGDRFAAAVTVHNHTGADGTATVKIQGVGFHLLASSTKKVHVPNGEAREVYFPVVTTRPGLMRFRFSGFIGNETDSVEPPALVVYLPATTEATATYGVTTRSVAQPIFPPKNALPQFGGLKVSMSSTALTGLEDAARFLTEYPYHFSGPIASRLLMVFSIGDILTHFKLGTISDRKHQAVLARRGIRRLLTFQRYDGGFKYWPGDYRSWPYISTYITWVLGRGMAAGFQVPQDKLLRACRYVSNVLRNHSRPYMAMMAGWVLTGMKRLKVIPAGVVRSWNLQTNLVRLFPKHKHAPLFVKAWYMTALHRIEGNSGRVAELRRRLENSAVQTPYGVHFSERVTEAVRLLFHSETRTDSIVLSSFVEAAPRSPLVPKLVRALMAARIKGRWENTQANVFALDALARYYRKFEKVVPNFKASVWLGNGYAGTARFEGRSMTIKEKLIPMGFLLRQGPSDVILAKKGPGKLYYRLGISYAPRSLRLRPQEQGFTVARTYEPVGKKSTVTKGKDGIWRIKAGSYVRVRLIVVVPDRRYYVAVDDPLPAGLEPVHKSFKTTASQLLRGGYRRYRPYRRYGWRRRYYHRHRGRYRRYWLYSPSPVHTEMRDSRALLFWGRMPASVYEYTYMTRATTSGRFVVPPLKAHEMYHPEVFGRNATAIVEVYR